MVFLFTSANVINTNGKTDIQSGIFGRYVNAINRSLKEGRDKGGKGYYRVVFNKNEIVEPQELCSYLLSRDIFIRSGSMVTADAVRFGYSITCVKSVDIIPRNEFELAMLSLSSDEKLVQGRVMWLPGMTRKGNSSFMEVYWTGGTSNSGISGNGVGYTKLKEGSADLYVVIGSFDKGAPVGHCQYYLYNVKYDKNKHLGYSVKNTYSVIGRPFSNGYAAVSFNGGGFGFVNENGVLCVPYQYNIIVSDFCPEGYAILKRTSNGKEVKVNGQGQEIGLSDAQIAADEALRKAEEHRKAEEKRKEEMRKEEIRKYNAVVHYYESFQEQLFWKSCDEYVKDYPGNHKGAIDTMKAVVRVRSKLIKERSNIDKWRTGNQVCQITSDGLILGSIEKFNEDRTAIHITINAAPRGSYSGQTLTEGRQVWIQKDMGWHLALTEEIVYARNNSTARSIDDPLLISVINCSGCNGRGSVPCYLCGGTGYIHDRICNRCEGKGSHICSKCGGSGR